MAAGGPGVAGGQGVAARRLAVDAFVRIERQRAYANLLLPQLLERSELSRRDRAFVTELVYGTTRMQRACDWLVDRFTVREPDREARAWLRLGAYQLAFTDVPAHAAVSATVEAAPRKMQGFLNAVLRRVSEAPMDWPSDAVRLSYPDWIVDQLVADLGREDALATLDAMNLRPRVTRRDDGYIQDLASQWVAELVDVEPDSRVFDAAAAPGGKATAMARGGALVVAGDVHPRRTELVRGNAAKLGLATVVPLVADAQRPPFPRRTFDRVLLDAPCSGLGALRRRPDARWRVDGADVDRLADLQRELVGPCIELVRPGGMFVYSVCTLTAAETSGIDEQLEVLFPRLVADPPKASPWRSWGRGAILLPHEADTDGMYVLRLRVPE
jgi:16S rRNA (cytosine967-C5)-methyltransferase